MGSSLLYSSLGCVAASAVMSTLHPNRGIAVFLAAVAIFSLAHHWEALVSHIVPEPYLDEVFHVPQAQAYCDGKWSTWDPKLTTPPGLYLISFGLYRFLPLPCAISELRFTNVIAIVSVFMVASTIASKLHNTIPSSPSGLRSKISWTALHSSVNIAIFPPLFFFSGLYYTDVVSTLLVLLTYYLHMTRSPRPLIFLSGLASLSLRQTNIFWVAIFLGGLEFVRTVREISGKVHEKKEDASLNRQLEWMTGTEIHDPKLSAATAEDFILTPISLVSAILHTPTLFIKPLLSALSPYLALILSFATFILWNKGVVLGDKANHTLTIHLPQLLYLTTFTTFFSLPLVLPSLLTLAHNTLQPPPPPAILATFPNQNNLAFRRSFNKFLWTLASVGVTAIVACNTVVHPFTLADNRHYMFYIFRYSILRHTLIKYLLIPIYLAAASLCFHTLAGPHIPTSPYSSGSSTPQTGSSTPNTRTSTPRLLPKNSSLTTSSRSKTPSTSSAASSISSQTPSFDAITGQSSDAPRTSFFLVLVLATILSLFTAPLVEPRYFILPWVFWRLHVQLSVPAAGDGSSGLGALINRCLEPKYLLWLETAWFMAINLVTGYVFLYRGFGWAQEPGVVQRFMW